MILETDRLYLRKLTLKDVERFRDYRNKKEVAKYQSWNHYSIFRAKYRIQQCLMVKDDYKINVNYNLGIVLKENKELIGDLFVNIIGAKTFCLGYTLDSDYWKKGYATEMILGYLEYMKSLGYSKVVCYLYPENLRSVHLLERLGFTPFESSDYYEDIGYMKYL